MDGQGLMNCAVTAVEGKETAAEYERRIKGLVADREAREKQAQEEFMSKLEAADLGSEEGLQVAAEVLGNSISRCPLPPSVHMFLAFNLCFLFSAAAHRRLPLSVSPCSFPCHPVSLLNTIMRACIRTDPIVIVRPSDQNQRMGS